MIFQYQFKTATISDMYICMGIHTHIYHMHKYQYYRVQIYIHVCVCTAFFVILTQTGITCYVEASFEDLPSSDWPVCLSVGHFLGWSLIEKGQAHCEWCHI